MYCVTVQEARCAKANVLAELVSSEGCEGESVPCLCSSFWQIAGSLGHSLAYESIAAFISAFIFTWRFPCVCLCANLPFQYEYQSCWLGAYPTPELPHLN